MFGEMYLYTWVVLLLPFQVGPADLAEKKPVTSSNMTGELCATVWLTFDVCLQFYSVLDGDEDMIFMHVDSPGGAVSRFLTSSNFLHPVRGVKEKYQYYLTAQPLSV